MGVGIKLRKDSTTGDVPSSDAAHPTRPQPPARRESSTTRMHLGELLVGAQLITNDQLAEALLQQSSSGKRIGTLLVELGAIGERDLAKALSTQLHVPLVDLSQQTPTPEAIEHLPESVCRSHLAVPLVLESAGLTIAVSDPNPELAKILANASGRVVRLVIAPRSDIQRAIDTAYRALGNIQEHVRAFEETAEAAPPRRSRNSRPDGDRRRRARRPGRQPAHHPGLRDRASDIHIEPQNERLRVRFRIDGPCTTRWSCRSAMAPALVSRLKIMAGMNIVERRRPQDGQITMEVDGREIDIRVSTVATIWGENCVMRVLDKSRSLFRMGDLGMPPDTHEVFTRLIRSPFGMVLCAGPTGSGKTTTLYAALSEIDDPSRNIMTIEDPVEYMFPSINQIQTNEQAGITFANGLRSILRQDPDVILVGEIRDVETARIAVQSALTGHFVLSSLHATDSVGRPAPLPRHGDRVLPDRLLGRRRRRASAWSGASARPARRRTSRRPRSSPSTRRAAGAEGRTSSMARAATSAPEPATWSASACTSSCGSPGDQAAHRRMGDPGRAATHGRLARDADPAGRSHPTHHPGHHDDRRSRPIASTRSERRGRHGKVQIHRDHARREHRSPVSRTPSPSTVRPAVL